MEYSPFVSVRPRPAAAHITSPPRTGVLPSVVSRDILTRQMVLATFVFSLHAFLCFALISVLILFLCLCVGPVGLAGSLTGTVEVCETNNWKE